MDIDQYTKHREKLLDFQLNQAGMFDRAILTLSAGALGLSLTFVKDFIPEPSTESIETLYFAWIFFICSLLATLLSFQTSQHGLTSAIASLDQIISHKTTAKDDNNIWGKFCVPLNWASLVFFILGAYKLSSFVKMNL